MEPLRVVIADDHALFRDGLRALLATEPGAELVGEAATGEEAVALTRELQPDVVLMDVKMPGMGGVEATRKIFRESPHVGVLMVTMHEDDQSVFTAMRAGARGYILKGAKYDDMIRAIRAVASGDAIFSPSIARRMMDFFASMRPARTQEILPELSQREREILVLIAEGHKNAEIAAQLDLSPKTVRNHVSNILDKLQVADRTQAVVRAKEAGLA